MNDFTENKNVARMKEECNEAIAFLGTTSHNEGIQKLIEMANNHNYYACRKLGELYCDGNQVEKNYSE